MFALVFTDLSFETTSRDIYDIDLDLFLDTFFVEGDSSEEANSAMLFGPEIDLPQFLAKLNNDMDQAYQRKCKKISGSDDTYSKFKAAIKELRGCLKNFLKSDEIRSAYSKLKNEGDNQSLIKT